MKKAVMCIVQRHDQAEAIVSQLQTAGFTVKVHNDYTESSGPQCVRDLMGQDWAAPTPKGELPVSM